MIIVGTRGVTYKKGTGEFHCPMCQDRRPYGHKRVRRFFTLYFIPLIPMDLLGEYVECPHCRNTYRLEVLTHDPSASNSEFEAEFTLAVKRVMVEMMLADGEIDDAEVEAIREIHTKLVGRDITYEEVQAEIEQAQSAKLGAIESLRAMAGRLNDQGKEAVIQAAYLVAAADGHFDKQEIEFIAQIGQSLGMSLAHVQGVMHTMMQQSESSQLS